MKITTRIFLLAFISILISACNTASKTTPSVENTATPVVSAYPSPEIESTAYPAPPVEESANPAAPTAVEAYPYPAPLAEGTAFPEAYPAPEDATNNLIATSGPAPTSSPDSSVILGRLTEKGKPVVDATIYLADVRTDESGEYQVAAYSRSSSPRAYTDTDGQFVFANIAPGNYCLVLDNNGNFIILNIPGEEADQALKFVTEAGEVTDLGTLDYEDLPES